MNTYECLDCGVIGTLNSKGHCSCCNSSAVALHSGKEDLLLTLFSPAEIRYLLEVVN